MAHHLFGTVHFFIWSRHFRGNSEARDHRLCCIDKGNRPDDCEVANHSEPLDILHGRWCLTILVEREQWLKEELLLAGREDRSRPIGCSLGGLPWTWALGMRQTNWMELWESCGACPASGQKGPLLSALSRSPPPNAGASLSCLTGIAVGYLSLYIISWIFLKLTGKEGIGEGDFDLLALIGAFIGPWYCWQVLWIGSITGSIYGITLMYAWGTSKSQRIPFGPFLSIGAIVLVLIHFYAPWLLTLASIS